MSPSRSASGHARQHSTGMEFRGRRVEFPIEENVDEEEKEDRRRP